jgi:proton translocating ATP synthase F1 alpha subunit
MRPYNSIITPCCRIALRAKVNDSLISGLTIIDTILPVGRGQRQLILGDRFTGKTSIFISFIIYSNRFNYLGSLDGFGSKRLFTFYIGINQNLSKLSLLIFKLFTILYSLFITSHSSSSSLLSFLIPLIGVAIAERLRDRAFDSIITFDDLSKHSKSYRQISLLIGKIPSRDAFPADIFNIHSSLLERCCKLSYYYYGSSISGLPIIETINSDITEFIATNIISITDGQFYTNKKLFLNYCRPAIDSGLSVSRIGSNAQSKLIKLYSYGIKNEITLNRSLYNSLLFNDNFTIYTIELSLFLLLIAKVDL